MLPKWWEESFEKFDVFGIVCWFSRVDGGLGISVTHIPSQVRSRFLARRFLESRVRIENIATHNELLNG